MKRSYRYRLYPTKKRQRLLNDWLELCCDVYNAALDERKSAYRVAGVSIDYTQQCAELPGCKEVRPELAHVNSQVLQDVVKRVDLAFAGFFRRMAQGQKAGYPRLRSRHRYNSLTFKQYGNSFSFSAQGKLVLSKIGHVKLVKHRPGKGTPKAATVSRSSTGKWYVSISCDEVPEVQAFPTTEEVGIDVGLKTFAYLSTGEHIETPRFFREEREGSGESATQALQGEEGHARESEAAQSGGAGA